MQVYFGTYTRRTSEGIYAADFDPETGSLSNARLFASEPNPTYLAFAKDGHIYTVGSENGKGGSAAWSAEGQPINHVVQEGAATCYVSVDEERSLVYGANYHKGQVIVYKKEADGSLSLADLVTRTGSGPHPNQESSHVHFANLTPDRYLVACDLGTDQVITYEVSNQGKLTEINSYQATPGAGPRHLVFHSVEKIAYLICELNSTIEVLIYDGVGDFELLQVVSLLPEDYTGVSSGAAIRISKDNRFLYGSNRGHDSIACYQIGADGQLTLMDIVPTEGNIPRDFQLTPDERHLIVAHQDSDNVSVFQRDTDSGKLTLLSSDFVIPEGVCVSFPAI